MAQDQDSKTEEPTGKRIEKSREEGQVAVSQEVKTWATFLGATLLVALLAPWAMRRLSDTLVPFLASPHALRLDDALLRGLTAGVAGQVGLILAAPFALLLLGALAGSIGQQGWLFTPSKLAPRLSNISPIQGFKRMFSVRSLVEFGKGVLKLGLIGTIAATVIWPRMGELPLLPGMELPATLSYLHQLLIAMMVAIVLSMLVIAAADFLYQRYDHMKKLRMTKQEVKDEHKQAEGDPVIKNRLRQLRLEKARKRMMQAVPKADVVITNPTHYAVAMRYQSDRMNAPVVVAKGVDFLALQIRRLAEEHQVTIVENPPLARALYAAVELDQEIPPEHYKAVAEIISYVMRLKGKLRR